MLNSNEPVKVIHIPKLANHINLHAINSDTFYEKTKILVVPQRYQNSEGFISKLRITENKQKLDVSENDKVVHDFEQDEIYEGSVKLVKVN